MKFAFEKMIHMRSEESVLGLPEVQAVLVISLVIWESVQMPWYF